MTAKNLKTGLLWRLDEPSLLDSILAAVQRARSKYGRSVVKVWLKDEPPPDLNLAVELGQDNSTQAGHLFAEFGRD